MTAHAQDKDDDTFHGWMTLSATSPLTYQAFTPKAWEETDVDIDITHCGVCASDLHTMRSGWVNDSHFPFIWYSSTDKDVVCRGRRSTRAV